MRREFRDRIEPGKLGLLLEFQTNPSKSVKELAEAIGVPVIEVEMPIEKTAYLDRNAEFFDDTGYVIYVNSRHSKERKRWAVAHELGHFFLHRGRNGPFDGAMNLQSDKYSYFMLEKEEAEAHRFAEDLLLSERALDALARHGRTGISEIARAVGIPSSYVEHRLRHLRR